MKKYLFPVLLSLSLGSVFAQSSDKVIGESVPEVNAQEEAQKTALKQKFYASMQTGLEFGQCQSRVMYLAKSEKGNEQAYEFNQKNFDFARDRGQYSMDCQEKGNQFAQVMKSVVAGEFSGILKSEEMLDYSVILGICEASFSVEDVFKTQENIRNIKYYDAYFEGQILQMFKVGSKAGFRESCLDVYTEQQKLVAITQMF